MLGRRLPNLRAGLKEARLPVSCWLVVVLQYASVIGGEDGLGFVGLS